MENTVVEVVAYLISWSIGIGLCIVIANWGKTIGMRWGQVWLFGIVVSPVIAAILVFMYSVFRKIRLTLSKQ